ncbi:hypothetical protein FRC98_07025 [Lujinxingia vulgaris]|uniref:Uncharacterized protein n=1 Tax=Lujinxingia vulgaris TaxID=2600176 RepID=A0A5C6XH15_9DELT|nr:hypothetical protein [Lujinxingia vulgaris]TXD37442.1 hypothetical protein FRC98_07025 [Lujinxingia vulgaris]
MAVNVWCKALNMDRPSLEKVKDHRDANTYSRLIVALLERGEPMTLDEVAERFEEAGIASRSRALLSLQRCKPARPPIYRDGDRYTLDPYDDELDLWCFRLDLRPPKIASPPPPQPDPEPIPAPQVPLSPPELDEAWSGAILNQWSATRLVFAVLDAHGGEPMAPEDIVDVVSRRTPYHTLDSEPVKFRRKNSAVIITDDGRWAFSEDAKDTLEATRIDVRERIKSSRRNPYPRMSAEVIETNRKAAAQLQHASAQKLASLSRALLLAFPPEAPQAVALLDVRELRIDTYVAKNFDALRQQIAGYDYIGAQDVRTLLRSLDLDPTPMRLAELGPPRQTLKLSERGRPLTLTTELLVRSSCGIRKPFTDPKKLESYVAEKSWDKLRTSLEADIKSLFALYMYGKVHGVVRVRKGSHDQLIAAPWVYRDEYVLFHLKDIALKTNTWLEVVVGQAPSWDDDPWSTARTVSVIRDDSGWRTWLIDAHGMLIDEFEVQRARLHAAPNT